MARPEDTVILIPSLHPDEKLVRCTQDLSAHGFTRIVIVDDGSGPDYADLFRQAAAVPGCVLLTCPVNRGKGHALKLGIRHVLEKYPDAPGVVTADSDGQHTAQDCLAVSAALLAQPDKLVLGTRDFSLPQVPGKNRAGNRLTSFFFAALYGHWLPDTQTGLRGISRALLPRMLVIPGDRFEYEMNMLIHCAGWHLDFHPVPIRTIYLEENRSSHFRAFRDSTRIYALLFRNFFKFASSSALSTLLDVSLFTLLVKWALPATIPAFSGGSGWWLVLSATAGARVCSSLFNFRVNRQFVFHIARRRGALTRYAVLVAAVMLLSAFLVYALNNWLGMHKTLAKILVDSGLFFLNYRIQKAWVFAGPDERKKPA